MIHPCAKILAETGPIVIGENNLIEENVTIINKFVVGVLSNWYNCITICSRSGNTEEPLVIGTGNVFEVGACILIVHVW